MARKLLQIHLSRLVKQLNNENFKFIHKENRLANVLRFSNKPIQAREFWKISGFFGRVFPQKTYRFSMEAFQN